MSPSRGARRAAGHPSAHASRQAMSRSAEDVVEAFASRRHEFEHFARSVHDYFVSHPALAAPPLPIVHSVKSRVKDVEHLREKIVRKSTEDDPITKENLFKRVTDLCGVRVLHLHHQQFPVIHAKVLEKVEADEWVLAEKPVAYTWDPESAAFFGAMAIRVAVRDTYYTSIHYVVRPNRKSAVACEIQVRTLFEEIWGEIDHALNYPNPTQSFACREQLRVLAKLVSTGTRLGDAIFASLREHEANGTSGSASIIETLPEQIRGGPAPGRGR